MRNNKIWTTVGLTAALLPLLFAPFTAEAGLSKRGAQIDAIEGSKVKKITLDDVALKRLGVATTPLVEMQLPEKQMVQGEVIALPQTVAESKAQIPMLGVRIAVEPSAEITALLKDRWIRVIATTDSAESSGYTAQWMDPVESGASEKQTQSLYFALDSSGKNLTPGQQIQAELLLPSKDKSSKAVPYSSILYDTEGQVWVYTSPSKGVFVREKVVVSRIDNDLAFIQEGPATGSEIVTVAVIELYGLESGIGK